jgi:hypothetical protein
VPAGNSIDGEVRLTMRIRENDFVCSPSQAIYLESSTAGQIGPSRISRFPFQSELICTVWQPKSVGLIGSSETRQLIPKENNNFGIPQIVCS